MPPKAVPAPAFFAPERLARIDTLVEDQIRRGEMAGAIVLVAHRGHIVHQTTRGLADSSTGRPLRRDALFRWYSMTKPVTAVALMMLHEEGRFGLDDPIARYLPEFREVRVLSSPDAALDDSVRPNRAPTIHDLLRHTAGFTHGGEPGRNAVDTAYRDRGVFDRRITLAESVRRLARIPLRYQPGEAFHYSIAPDVEARLVEVLSGMPFATFLERRIFTPLGMTDTGFSVSPEEAARLAALHWTKEGRLVPCNAREGCLPAKNFLSEESTINDVARPFAHTPGSYGLIGTADDYLRFAQMLANGGEFGGRRILSPATVRFMTGDHLGAVAAPASNLAPTGLTWGLGFEIMTDPAAAGVIGNPGTFYWAGAAGTLFWIDPADDLVVVMMTQRMGAAGLSWAAERARLAAIIYGAAQR